jgi:MSHA biogenesis protein MshJ
MNPIPLLIARINRASLRERSLMFLAGVAAIAVLWNQLVMTPLSVRRVVLAQSLEDIRVKATALTAANPIDAAAARYASLKSREQALNRAIAEADEDLASAQNGLIEPTRMVSVLTDVLQRQKGLTLLRLRNLPVQSVLMPQSQATSAAKTDEAAGAGGAQPRPDSPAGAGGVAGAGGAGGAAGPNPAAAAEVGPYLHPVELVVRGGYLDVLAYLKDLEAQPWGLQWRRFEFVTTADGPEYRIEFTTLSMASNWLGV